MSRPEEQAPPDVFYNDVEANKYLHSSRMIQVQAEMAERALEMLCLPDDASCYLLDVGCGTGLSGQVLDENDHTWMGVDISADMLAVAKRRGAEGDLVHQDMGNGLPFRQGVFDGAISISAVQWLCYSDRNQYQPRQRLLAFFQTLYKCLRRGARAVLQFYPKDAEQLQLITASAMRAGFGGGLVVDFPHSTKAKKYFLVLLAGPADDSFSLPQAMGVDEPGSSSSSHAPTQVRFEQRQHARRKRNGKDAKLGTRDWIIQKKQAQRRRGDSVRPDSKYTGRKRSKPKF